MATKRPHKGRAKRRKRTRRPFDPAARLWTVPQCVPWSGLPYATILRLVKTGVIDAIKIGGEVPQNFKKSGKQRARSCAKYMILSRPFIAWVDGFAPGDKLTVTKTAA